MSDLYVQQNSASGTSTATAALNGVVAGNSIVAFFFTGSTTTPTNFSVADGQGSYTKLIAANVTDSVNSICSNAFLLQNANAGTHTVVGTSDSGDSVFIVVAEIGAAPSYSTSGIAAGQNQSNPGTGANALSSTSLTVAGPSTIVELLEDTSSVNTSDEPTAGTSPFSFTSRTAAANVVIGAWRLATAPGSSNGAATGTAITGTDRFITLGVAVLNPGNLVTPDAGSMTLSGLAPTAILGSTIATPGAGSMTLSGLAPKVIDHFGGQLFTVGWTQDDFSQVGGAAVVGGFAPDTSAASVTPGVGTLAFNGLAPVITVSGAGNITVTPGAGTLTLSGLAPTKVFAFSFQPGAGSLVLNGLAPAASTTANQTSAPGSGTLVLSGLAPSATTTANVFASPGAAALVISGQTPAALATANVVATPANGALTLNGLAPVAATTANVVATPGAGSLVLTGYFPAVDTAGSSTAQPGAAALALTGLAPSLSQTANQTAQPGAGALVLTGQAPTIDSAIAVPAGALTLTGQQPIAATTNHQTVAPDSGALTLAGYAPVITSPLGIQVPAGSMTFTGYAPRVTNSGDRRRRRNNATDPKLIARQGRRKHPNIVFKSLEPQPRTDVIAAAAKQIAEASVPSKPEKKASGLLLKLIARAVVKPEVPRETVPPVKIVRPVKRDDKPSAPPPEHPREPVEEKPKPPPKPAVVLPPGVEEALAEMRAELEQSIIAISKDLERERGMRLSAEERLALERERERKKRNQRIAAQLAAQLLIE